uniref:Uncharacterized protein n=1 Tax=Caenorhabditis japonica TaxID=281687 RepID=A0A8R1DJR9_CAEJA
MKTYVETYFPNCLKVFNIPGIFVHTDPDSLSRLLYLAVFIMSSGAVLYLLIGFALVYQIQQQCLICSQSQFKYHQKVFKDTIVQNIFRAICLLAAPLIAVATNFMDPQRNTMAIASLASLLFAAAPIPCTVAMLFQNEMYRKFILSKFRGIYNKSGNSDVAFERSQMHTGVGRPRTLIIKK